MLSINLDASIMYVNLWRRRLIQALSIIAPFNGTQAITDMLVGIMPIHQTDMKHTFSSGMNFSLGYLKVG